MSQSPLIPPAKLMFADIDTSREPIFTVSEAAKLFFARTASWLRWRERTGSLRVNNQEVGTGRSDANSRRYSLADIEKVAHALAVNGAISSTQLKVASELLHWQGRLWKYI